MTADTQRMEFIQNSLAKWNLQALRVEPLGSNNTHVYRVDFANPLDNAMTLSKPFSKPGVSTIPHGTTSLVFRISNSNAGLSEAYQIQNAVAIMTLARQALRSFPKRIVPLVFEWEEKTDDSPGFSVVEWMEGVKVSDEFKTLESEKQMQVMRQMAQVIKGLQDFVLPVAYFGGIGFDEQGNLIGREMNIPCGGPFDSYAELCRGMFDWQLRARDSSRILSAVDERGVRNRIERFKEDENGLQKILSAFPNSRPVIIHGDLHLFNCLFDPDTLQISALLDWDFAHLAAPISEFVHSLQDLYAFIEPKHSGSDDEKLLRNYLLTRFPDVLPTTTKVENEKRGPGEPRHVDWELAQAFNDCLLEVGAAKPSNINSAADMTDFWSFTQDLCPWFFLQERKLDQLGPEKTEKMRREADDGIDAQLREWGF